MIALAILLILATVAIIANSRLLDRRAARRGADDAYAQFVNSDAIVEAIHAAGDRIVAAIEENARLRPILNPPNRGVDFEEKLAKLKKAAAPPQLAEGELPRPIIVQAD